MEKRSAEERSQQTKALARWENEGGYARVRSPMRFADDESLGDAARAAGEPKWPGRRLGEMNVESGSAEVRVKRAYEPRTPDDGQRVLVDRLWPRGLSKGDLEDAVWIRDVAPTAALRKWFGHKPERWERFRSRYFAELRQNPAVDILKGVMASGRVTLLYGARDQTHNQAVALAAYLRMVTDPS